MGRYPYKINILSVILCFFVTIFIFVVAFLGRMNFEPENGCTLKTTAVISDVIYETDSKSYYPVFSFTYNGEEHIIVSRISSPNLKYKKGKTVEFYIDPKNLNKHYCTKELNPDTCLFLFFICFGIVLLIISIITLKIYISLIKKGRYKKFTLF
jgi:hypothetical protein